jgi:hypothetical protein
LQSSCVLERFSWHRLGGEAGWSLMAETKSQWSDCANSQTLCLSQLDVTAGTSGFEIKSRKDHSCWFSLRRRYLPLTRVGRRLTQFVRFHLPDLGWASQRLIPAKKSDWFEPSHLFSLSEIQQVKCRHNSLSLVNLSPQISSTLVLKSFRVYTSTHFSFNSRICETLFLKSLRLESWNHFDFILRIIPTLLLQLFQLCSSNHFDCSSQICETLFLKLFGLHSSNHSDFPSQICETLSLKSFRLSSWNNFNFIPQMISTSFLKAF